MNFLNNLNVDRFLFSLQYMWKGMLCIFVVIGVIIIAINVMNSITNKMASKQKADDDK